MTEPALELTDRERLIAEHAAKMAVAQVMDEFYKNVGRGIIHKFFVIVGSMAVAFAVGKGWISLPK